MKNTIEKKLFLNKKTISNLEKQELKFIKAGLIPEWLNTSSIAESDTINPTECC